MGRKSRYGLIALGVALAVAIGAGAWGYSRLEPYARIGATYIAKQDCSCLFVEGRSQASCAAEFKPDIDRFKVSIDRAGLPDSAKVTTRIAVFSGQATYARGYGCAVSR